MARPGVDQDYVARIRGLRKSLAYMDCSDRDEVVTYMDTALPMLDSIADDMEAEIEEARLAQEAGPLVDPTDAVQDGSHNDH